MEASLREQAQPSLLRDMVMLTKPRIISLLLVTTVPAMILAAGGLPDLLVLAATMVGGTFAAGSANALNCYVDRDIDAVMRRTGHRPLARREVSPVGALVFGRIGDLTGRKFAFLATLLIMGGSTAAIGFLPGYERIGILAPIVLVILRLLQGLALGGEPGVREVIRNFAADFDLTLGYLLTEGAIEKARADLAAAEAKASEYEQRLREAKVAIFKAQEARRQAALMARAALIAEARDRAQAQVRQARERIAQELELAKRQLQPESERLANLVIRTILKSVAVAQSPAGGGQ